MSVYLLWLQTDVVGIFDSISEAEDYLRDAKLDKRYALAIERVTMDSSDHTEVMLYDNEKNEFVKE